MNSDSTAYGHSGAPLLIGVDIRDEETGDEGTVMSDEPRRIRSNFLTKQEMELEHIRKFSQDLEASGRLPLTDIRPASNPPDFTAYEDSLGPIGFECTTLTTQRRRRNFHLFRDLRQRLLDLGPRPGYAAMQGCVIGICFQNDEPPRRGDTRTLETIANSLATFGPPLEQIRANPSMPYWPSSPRPEFSLMVSNYLGTELIGSFADQFGFEVVPRWNLPIWDSEVLVALRRTIKQHDRPGVHVLLVSTSAPDREGWQWLSDTLTYDSVLRQIDRIDAPANIRAITIHDYVTGRFADVWRRHPKTI